MTSLVVSDLLNQQTRSKEAEGEELRRLDAVVTRSRAFCDPLDRSLAEQAPQGGRMDCLQQSPFQ